MGIRVCPHCRKPLIRKAGEKPSTFARRRYCNPECGFAGRSSQAVERAGADVLRRCGHCRKVLTRKRYRGVLESAGAFAKRKFCNPECRGASMRGRPFPNTPAVERVPWSPPPAPRLVSGDPRVSLRECLRLHPDLVSAFEEVERDVSLDAWEPYSQAAVKGVTA